MKILQINASYKPAYIYGGPTMSVSKLCEELIKAGKNIEVLTTTANGEKELQVKTGIPTIVKGVPVVYFRRLLKGNNHLSPTLLFSISKKLTEPILSNHQPKLLPVSKPIVHIHAWWNMVSVGSCLLAHLLSGKVILSPRGTLSNYSFNNRKSHIKNAFHYLIGKSLLRRCHFHVSTEKEKQDILNIINPRSITVIPNFVNLGCQPPVVSDLEIASTPFKILFLSRIEEKKGLDRLFYALQNLRLNYHLTIAGSGTKEYMHFLKTLASELGITEKITWIGQQRNEDKFKLLAEHNLMVLPSHDESFANVVIESLSVGTPVLITYKVGLADYVIENNYGWVCTNNTRKLAATLKEAYLDNCRRTSIRENAPDQIRADYDEKYLIKMYLKMYNLVENRRQ